MNAEARPQLAAVPDAMPGSELPASPEAVWRVVSFIIRRPWSAAIRLQVHGRDRIPQTGPFVLAANHVSWSDPFIFGLVIAPRPIYYMAKRELWKVPVVGSAIPFSGAFPVDRGQPDRQAIRSARAVLANDGVLGVFVEGTRQKTNEIGSARSGAAMFAIGAGAPVVPMCVRGSAEHARNPLHPTTIAIGEPLDLSHLGKGGAAYKDGAEWIETELRRLDEFLRACERAGRPSQATPPTALKWAGRAR